MSNLKAALKTYLMANMDGKLDCEMVGLRYDNKDVKVGDILGDSKANWERDEDRDFPEFGSEEYDNATDLDGTCCYSVCDGNDLYYADTEEEIDAIMAKAEKFISENSSFEHLSIVFGDQGQGEVEDQGEVLIKDPEIAKVLY